MALGIIGVLGAVGSASPNNSDHDHRDDKDHSTLTVVGKNPENKVVDLGAQGPSQGDIRVTNAPLYEDVHSAGRGDQRTGRGSLPQSLWASTWGEGHKRRDGQVRWCGGRTTLRTPWKEGHRHRPLHRVVLE